MYSDELSIEQHTATHLHRYCVREGCSSCSDISRHTRLPLTIFDLIYPDVLGSTLTWRFVLLLAGLCGIYVRYIYLCTKLTSDAHFNSSRNTVIHSIIGILASSPPVRSQDGLG